MEDSCNGNRSQVIALVVRQFAPSRIERQLLAQTFDLLCHEQHEPLDCSAARHVNHQFPAQDARDLFAEPQLAGRAAS